MNPEATEKTSLPGLLLALFGVSSILLSLLGLLFNLVTNGLAAMNSGDMVGYLISVAVSLGFSLVFSTVGMLASAVTVLGGMRLRQARSPMLVYAGAAFAMIPCCSGVCCLFGLPIGAYAIFVMQDDAVRAAMAEG